MDFKGKKKRSHLNNRFAKGNLKPGMLVSEYSFEFAPTKYKRQALPIQKKLIRFNVACQQAESEANLKQILHKF
jgi:hypothetical protein